MTDTATEYLWPLSDLYDSINSGIHLVNHLGHGWYDHTMKMDIPDLDGLVNTKHCFVYSQCCMAGGFDNPEGYDCIAEHLMVKNMHGAFAGIWNSRFGVGAIESTDGASQRYHREFIDAIFGEHKLRLGAANHDSKEDNLWRIDEDEQWMRLCYYQTNLFGDPAVCFHINLLPETPSCPVGPQTGKSGISYQFETSSVDPLNESLYYQWDWGDGELSEWMGPYKSGTPCVISHIWLSLGINTVKVRARNAMIYPCSTWSVERNVTIYDYDVNDDGLVNPVDVGYVKMFYGYNTSIDAYAIYDVNFDDQIDPKDVGLIKFYYGPWP